MVLIIGAIFSPMNKTRSNNSYYKQKVSCHLFLLSNTTKMSQKKLNLPCNIIPTIYNRIWFRNVNIFNNTSSKRTAEKHQHFNCILHNRSIFVRKQSMSLIILGFALRFSCLQVKNYQITSLSNEKLNLRLFCRCRNNEHRKLW